jgi:DNA helicase-2/ATP-dependent DNA helicase PcrA
MDLSILNEPQREAVLHDSGPILVLAGAGSGKTRVITHRIARCLFDLGMRPWEIMALTFTNKAAREMNERVEKLINRSTKGLWIGTFHSICARILRIEGVHGGKFTIYDTDDQQKVIKRVLEKKGLNDSKRFTPKDIQGRISGLKNRMISVAAFRGMMNNAYDEQFSSIYADYEVELEKNEALDFDDIILRTIDLLRNNESVAHKYQTNIRQLLVDEYQDTNLAQYELIKKFTVINKNVMVVGDDDQSIYSWRGADLRNILEFEKSFPDAKVVKLEENYRSTKTVLETANAVIANNKHRKSKTLFTNGEKGDPIEVYHVADEREEAREIVRFLKGSSLRDSAIFYRTNAQSRAIEEMLRNSGLPYVIVGGTRFYERQEVKDVLAYLRVFANPSDSVSLFRIINVPRRGIGDKTLDKLRDYADQTFSTPYDALNNLHKIDLTGREASVLQNFKQLMDSLTVEKSTADLVAFVRNVVEKTGYLAFWQQSTEDGAEERLANIGELVNAVEEYIERTETATLEGFLEEVALITDLDQVKDSNADYVTLMTLHSSKGLEYERVCLAGLEEGLFPMIRNNDGDSELEEERRLFYVGITRAKKKLAILHTAYRRRYGTVAPAFPSSFLEELPEHCVIRIDRTAAQTYSSGNASQKSIFSEDKRQKIYEETSHLQPDYDNHSQVDVVFRKGLQVRHPVWGIGLVQSVSGVADNMKAEVRFGSAGVKKLMIKYAKLEPVG